MSSQQGNYSLPLFDPWSTARPSTPTNQGVFTLDTIEPSTPNDLDFLNSPSFQNFMASMDAESPTTTTANAPWQEFDASLPVFDNTTPQQLHDYFNLTTDALPPDFQDLTPTFLLDRTLLHLQDAEQEWLLAQSPLRTITMRTTPGITAVVEGGAVDSEVTSGSPASFAFEQPAMCILQDASPSVAMQEGVQATPALAMLRVTAAGGYTDHAQTMWHSAGSVVSSTNTPAVLQGAAGQQDDGYTIDTHRDEQYNKQVVYGGAHPQRITFASPVQSKLDMGHTLPPLVHASPPACVDSPATPTGYQHHITDDGIPSTMPTLAAAHDQRSTDKAARRAAVSHEGTKLYAMMLQHLQQQQNSREGTPVRVGTQHARHVVDAVHEDVVQDTTTGAAADAVQVEAPPSPALHLNSTQVQATGTPQSTTPQSTQGGTTQLGQGELDAWLASIGWTGVPPAVHTQLHRMWVAAGQLAHVMQMLQLGGKERGEEDPMHMLTSLEHHVEAMVCVDGGVC